MIPTLVREAVMFPQELILEQNRHCEPMGRAKPRPMTVSVKQPRSPLKKSGLIRRLAPRNDSRVGYRTLVAPAKAGTR